MNRIGFNIVQNRSVVVNEASPPLHIAIAFVEDRNAKQRWYRLSEQIFRVDKWSLYRV